MQHTMIRGSVYADKHHKGRRKAVDGIAMGSPKACVYCVLVFFLSQSSSHKLCWIKVSNMARM